MHEIKFDIPKDQLGTRKNRKFVDMGKTELTMQTRHEEQKCFDGVLKSVKNTAKKTIFGNFSISRILAGIVG